MKWPESCWFELLAPFWHSIHRKRGRGPGRLVAGDMMREIREIYQRWLDGDLSQEDALFAIGDVLGEGSGDNKVGAAAEERPVLNPVGQKGA